MPNQEEVQQIIFSKSIIQHELSDMLSAAITKHQAGELVEAANLYLSIINNDESNVVALNNLSLLCDDVQALNLLEKCIEVSPNYTDALINSIQRCINLGLFEKAKNYTQKARILAPSDERVIDMIERINSNYFNEEVCPRFTVIVPTHKRSHLLKRALESIKSQDLINQSCEVIVISDCQDSQTDLVCNQMLSDRDLYVRRNGNPGPSASRNLGIKLAKGQIILFLDDDDAWHQNLLADLASSDELGKGNPVYFNCTVINEKRFSDSVEFVSEDFLNMNGKINEFIYIKNQLHMSCLAIPAFLIQNIHFDDSMRAYEDWDFMLSLFDIKWPIHLPILGSKVFEVREGATDRRGSSSAANDFNAVMDYLYVYRRHKVNEVLQKKRSELLAGVGLTISSQFL